MQASSRRGWPCCPGSKWSKHEVSPNQLVLLCIFCTLTSLQLPDAQIIISHAVAPIPCLQIPDHCVVGAALESPSSFRVWYCTPSNHRSPSEAGPKYTLRKTAAYTCRSGQTAVQLVAQIRQSASWWGREQPPRLLAIVNPKSGQGK